MMDQTGSLASGTFYLTLMHASHYAVASIFCVMVARVLNPDEVGSFSLLLMVMTLFNTLSLLTLNNAVIKYVSEDLRREGKGYALALSEKAFKLISCASLPALVIGFIVSPIVKTGVLEVLSILVSAFILNLGALMDCTAFAAIIPLTFSLISPLNSVKMELLKSIMPWRLKALQILKRIPSP